MKKVNKSPSSKRKSLKGKRNGWLSPRGTFYPCSYEGHCEKASKIVKDAKKWDAEEVLENRGWIKVSASDWYSAGYSITQSQINTIFDWCKDNKEKYPPNGVQYMIEDMENGIL